MHSNLNHIFKSEKKQIIKLMIVFSMAIFVYIAGWNLIVKTDAYQLFNGIYNDFTVKIIQSLSSFQNKDINYNPESKIVSSTHFSSKLILPVEAYKHIFIAIILLLSVPFRHWKSSASVLLFVLLFLSIRGALITFILMFFKGTIHNVILVWLEPVFFVPFLFLGLFIVQHITLFNHLFEKVKKRFSEILTISFDKLLFLLIIIPALPRVFLSYLHADILPGISGFILGFSRFFIRLTGKTAEINGSIIYLDENWVDLEFPCIGMGVFTIIAVLIFAINGNFRIKVLYLSVFAFIYLILNALRLSVLLLYINNTYHQIGLNKLELHNNATYFMYLVAFGGFLGYWIMINLKKS